MNPSMPPDFDDAAEERRLQALFQAGESGYIDDAGFTARVLGRLPVARRHRQRRRWLLVGLATLVGGGLCGLLGGADLLAAGSTGWALAKAWSLQPMPGVAEGLTLGSALLLVASLGACWWAFPQKE